ncbi:hypothetical protein FOZ63_027270, partial [Perkinsus olseni]
MRGSNGTTTSAKGCKSTVLQSLLEESRQGIDTTQEIALVSNDKCGHATGASESDRGMSGVPRAQLGHAIGSSPPPPGYVRVVSHSRPGEYTYYCPAKDTRYATVEMAWAAYDLDHRASTTLPPQPNGYPPPAAARGHQQHHRVQQPQSPPTGSGSSSASQGKDHYHSVGPHKARVGSRSKRPTIRSGGTEAGKSWQLLEMARHERWSMRARLRRWIDRRRIRRHVKRHMWWRTMKASQNPIDAPPPDKVPRPGGDGLFMDKSFSPLDARNTIGPVSSEDNKSRLRLTPAERDGAVWIRIPDLIRMNCGLSHGDPVNLFDDTIEPNDLTQG